MMKKITLVSLLVISGLTLTACKSAEQLRQEEVARQYQIQLEKEEAQRKEIDKAVASVEDEIKDKFYYQLLESEADKELYALIFYNAKAKIAGDTPVWIEESEYAMNYLVLNDFPQYFWLYNESTEASLSESEQIQLYQDMETAADQIIAQMPQGSDYEKARYLYESVVLQTSYNHPALENDEYATQNQTIVSVLRDHLSVCAGYSRTFQYLCQKAGLEAIYVTGDTTDTLSEDYNHAWNLVRLNDQWYGVDTTWGDPTYHEETPEHLRTEIDYSWLCLPESILGISHFADTMLMQGLAEDYFAQGITYPSFTDNSLNFIAQKGGFFDSYNTDAITAYISNQLASGQRAIDFQFANKADYDAFIADLGVQNNYVAETIYYQAGADSYSYFWSDALYSITLNY